MKKIFVLAAAALSLLGAQAKGPYELVNDPQGYSYIQINEDVDSFTFTSDFKTIGDGSRVAFFVYPEGLEGQDLKRYNANVKNLEYQFGKGLNNNQVDLGARKAGDRVGFYLEHPYINSRGVITRYYDPIRFWTIQEQNGTPYISFNKVGSGNPNMMSIENISIKVGNSSAPAGQPLPGALAMLVLGGLGIGAAKLRGKKKA